ncbi:hypothetical protein [Aeromonas diversa]|uniref:hypothetical protein n=1 Tax=Aeromonas diversa TaxID=502790 RepID=UPI0012E010A9|nr:hypothetical protein [Aeromonas diversa]
MAIQVRAVSVLSGVQGMKWAVAWFPDPCRVVLAGVDSGLDGALSGHLGRKKLEQSKK